MKWILSVDLCLKIITNCFVQPASTLFVSVSKYASTELVELGQSVGTCSAEIG